MNRIAILGGGISGLAAAYELELARKRGADIDWHLYEASSRLGGIVETTRIESPEGNFILEGGPDAWVTEKPWARELAIELGLESQLIASNDATRKTYILIDNQLQPIPDRMRMMVPEDLSLLDQSPLFSPAAKAAYAAELTRADELKATAPINDESVASFVRRHFGEEVLTKIAAPLLSGVFGGDVHKLSVRSVMANFVTMEREHGSLIAGLQAKSKARGDKPAQPIFTTLHNGMGTLVDALLTQLPADRLHTNRTALSIKREGNKWCLRTTNPNDNGRQGKTKKHFRHIILATSVDATRDLLTPLYPGATTYLPTEASSAVLAAFTWPADVAATFTIPPGFGFLIPQTQPDSVISTEPQQSDANRGASGETCSSVADTSTPSLLACTFVDQKFPYRAPAGARILRTFFGGPAASILTPQTDHAIATAALTQLHKILGPIPDPTHTEVRRWPRSLPQYEVDHLDRMDQLDALMATIPNLTLLGNSYRGVGLPDLIHAARTAARKLTTLQALP